MHQKRYFKDGMSILIRMKSGEELSLQSSYKISNLDPFFDENEILHVHRRIKQSSLNTEYTHSILLSGEGILANLLVKWYHQSICWPWWQRLYFGYWIVQVNSVVPSFIARCVRYQYLCRKVGEEKMADPPADRIRREIPFKYVGVDIIAPFMVKQYTKEMKQYGIIPTCLPSGAVHFEVVQNMETHSFKHQGL